MLAQLWPTSGGFTKETTLDLIFLFQSRNPRGSISGTGIAPMTKKQKVFGAIYQTHVTIFRGHTDSQSKISTNKKAHILHHKSLSHKSVQIATTGRKDFRGT